MSHADSEINQDWVDLPSTPKLGKLRKVSDDFSLRGLLLISSCQSQCGDSPIPENPTQTAKVAKRTRLAKCPG